MDSVCEILINVVTANKPKVLTGLPKRERSQYRRASVSCREYRGSRRKGMDLTHSGMETKHGKPISLPASGKRPAREDDGGVGTRTWEKRMLLCNGGERG